MIIPSRDRWWLLGCALRTVLAQEGVDIELIVVDDGSSDETPARLAELSHPQLRVLRRESTGSVADARNAGLAAARADWVAFLDDDDLWAPSKLRAQLDAATAGGAGMALAAALVFGPGGDIIASEPPPAAHDLPARLRVKNAVPGGCSNVIVKTEIARRVGGFDRDLRLFADWDLWLRLVAQTSAAVLPEALVGYRKHDANMHMSAFGAAVVEFDRICAKHDLAATVDQQWFFRWMAGSLRRAGRRRTAALAYLRSAWRSRSASDVVRLVALAGGERVIRLGRREHPAHLPAAPDWIVAGLGQPEPDPRRA